MNKLGDLEARIKALEEKLTPPPDKMSTMKASNKLKQYLVALKKGTQEDAVWWLIGEAEKVPLLEKRIRELEEEIKADNEYISKMNGGN